MENNKSKSESGIFSPEELYTLKSTIYTLIEYGDYPTALSIANSVYIDVLNDIDFLKLMSYLFYEANSEERLKLCLVRLNKLSNNPEDKQFVYLINGYLKSRNGDKNKALALYKKFINFFNAKNI